MIIILEGENKCGKTTLAQHIVDTFNFDYIKCSQPKGDPYIQYMEILKNIKGNTVIDRFHIGESVYGPIYRSKGALSEEQIRNIELKALALNAVLIYCHDNASNIAERFNREKEEFASNDKIAVALKIYEEQIEKTILPVFLHKMMTPMDILKTLKIDKIIEYNCVKDDGKYKTIIGNVKDPDLILVGDRRNIKEGFKYNKIGQAFDFGPSSEFLFDNLKQAKIDLSKVAILNSDSLELPGFIKQNWSIMNTPIVISLGSAAHKVLKKHGIEHKELMHPSFYNRFHHNDNTLLNKLKSLNI